MRLLHVLFAVLFALYVLGLGIPISDCIWEMVTGEGLVENVRVYFRKHYNQKHGY